MAPQTRGRKRQITTTKATSPQPRGGGGGGGGKGKGRKRQTTTNETTSNERTIDEEEQLSDDEVYRPNYDYPAREAVLAECRKQKEESKKESKRGLKSLITYLEKMGMPAEQTSEKAIRQLVEGSLDAAKKDRISKRIRVRSVSIILWLKWVEV